MYTMYMTVEEAKKRLEAFMGDSTLTFTVSAYPENRWVAQCNEIDAIITGGTGFDLNEMEVLMVDAILAAADIPADQNSAELLKRALNRTPHTPPQAVQGVETVFYPTQYVLA